MTSRSVNMRPAATQRESLMSNCDDERGTRPGRTEVVWSAQNLERDMRGRRVPERNGRPSRRANTQARGSESEDAPSTRRRWGNTPRCHPTTVAMVAYCSSRPRWRRHPPRDQRRYARKALNLVKEVVRLLSDTSKASLTV